MGTILGCFFSLLFFALALAIYGYYSLALMTIAKKKNFPNPWMAFVPIANFWLMTQIAKKPVWWVVLCFIPFVNIYAIIMLWMDIAEVMGRPKNWGILAIVVVGAGMIAWGTWKPDFSVLRSGTHPTPPTPPPAR